MLSLNWHLIFYNSPAEILYIVRLFPCPIPFRQNRGTFSHLCCIFNRMPAFSISLRCSWNPMSSLSISNFNNIPSSFFNPPRPQLEFILFLRDRNWIAYYVTVPPWHLLVSIFMKTRSTVDPPYYSSARMAQRIFVERARGFCTHSCADGRTTSLEYSL